ncbi:ABC transporter substrate-binding protein [Hahella aquimaris]|uniref:glycine betaine ABC transporter substrate-binding protein OsmF n=1 Tax=Hahella sp. HNIBRBA332 TaxID=3015983 RepID=UPI00273CAB7E|nr:ABC transporter substrate-binding protein [Hahella sp. HNIBRBA332]WLQ12910.1 ABC transporter substrate-binding protein [Hahella sp. HNIBRBA332]
MNRKSRLGRLAAALVLGLSIATHVAAKDKIVVASKIDTEGSVLGNMILLRLEKAGYEVEDRIQLGATKIVRTALINGQIDVYPEYTGNAAFFFDMADSPVWKDPAKAYATAKEKDLAANNLVWLHPADANNTWAISVRGDLAREQKLATLDDLSRFLKDGGEIKLAASAEFVESEFALPAFQKAYGFELNADQLLVLSGGNTAATIRAAALRTNGVNAAMAYGTDGGLSALDMVVLQDPRNVQPVYEPAAVIRGEVLKANPELGPMIDAIFQKLDLTTLQRLNADVAVNGLDPKEVAREFLKSAGLL